MNNNSDTPIRPAMVKLLADRTARTIDRAVSRAFETSEGRALTPVDMPRLTADESAAHTWTVQLDGTPLVQVTLENSNEGPEGAELEHSGAFIYGPGIVARYLRLPPPDDVPF
jgi:hypothetical protein